MEENGGDDLGGHSRTRGRLIDSWRNRMRRRRKEGERKRKEGPLIEANGLDAWTRGRGTSQGTNLVSTPLLCLCLVRETAARFSYFLPSFLLPRSTLLPLPLLPAPLLIPNDRLNVSVCGWASGQETRKLGQRERSREEIVEREYARVSWLISCSPSLNPLAFSHNSYSQVRLMRGKCEWTKANRWAIILPLSRLSSGG